MDKLDKHSEIPMKALVLFHFDFIIRKVLQFISVSQMIFLFLITRILFFLIPYLRTFICIYILYVYIYASP